MDSRWFKEDRKLPSTEQKEAIEESKKALNASTLMSRRLKRILDDLIEECETKEENYEGEGWERNVARIFERRKTLKEIKKLLP